MYLRHPLSRFSVWSLLLIIHVLFILKRLTALLHSIPAGNHLCRTACRKPPLQDSLRELPLQDSLREIAPAGQPAGNCLRRTAGSSPKLGKS